MISCDKAKEKPQCPTASKVLDMAKPRDVQPVVPSLVSSGTTRGEPPSVQRSASISSEAAGKVIAIGYPGFKSQWTSCKRTARGRYDLPDLTARQGILGNSKDVAPRCTNHDRPCDRGSAQGPCRRLRAAS